MTKFDQALTDIFEGRGEKFSDHLRGLLRALYERGGVDEPAPPWPEGPSHIPVGGKVVGLANLRVGDRFQNGYLKGMGHERVVLGWQPGNDGAGVGALTTYVVRSENGQEVSPRGNFSVDFFHHHGPYRRTA